MGVDWRSGQWQASKSEGHKLNPRKTGLFVTKPKKGMYNTTAIAYELIERITNPADAMWGISVDHILLSFVYKFLPQE